MAQNLGIMFSIGATIGASVGASFASVNDKIKNTYQDINKSQKKARALGKALELKIDRDKIIAQLESIGDKGSNSYKKLHTELKKVSGKYAKAYKGAILYSRGVDSFAEAQKKANEEIEKSSKLQKKLQTIQNERTNRQNLRGQMLDLVAPIAAVAVPIKLSMDFESSLADVKKVTDFTPKGFKAFSKEMLDMSTRIPLAASELNQIAAEAGAAGIKGNELTVFTENASKMGIAFDMSASQAGEAMVLMRTNFKLNQDGAVLLGDSINALSNSFKAKASEVVNFANRTGGTASIYGFTAQEVAALGTSFVHAGLDAESAGTATNSMLIRLGTADKLSKDAQSSFAALGMSGEGMAKMFKEDAQGAMLQFLKAVKSSDDPMRHLNAILGAEHSPKIARLTNNLKEYEKALGIVSDTQNYQGSMEEEYAVRAKTTANTVILLKNTFSKLGISIGATVLPALNNLMNFTMPIIDSIANFAINNEWLTTTIMGLAAGFVGIRITMLGAQYVFSTFNSVVAGSKIFLDAFRKSGIAYTAVTKGMAIAQKGLTVAIKTTNLAIKANPIGATITAITGLVTWFAVLYAKTGSIKEAFLSMGQSFISFAYTILKYSPFGLLYESIKAVGSWFGWWSDDEEAEPHKKTEKKTKQDFEKAIGVKDEGATAFSSSASSIAIPNMSSTMPTDMPNTMSTNTFSSNSGVNVNMNFSLNGISDEGFATRVITGINTKKDDFERIISNIVHDAERVVYGS